MELVVGSENPVKRRATERAAPEDATVLAFGVDSGVSDQPRGHAACRAGAENRARRALDASDTAATHGVGLEGGVATLEGAFEGTDGRLWLVMWAAVTDGDRWGYGTGPSLVLPDVVADPVREGGELGPVLDEYLGTAGIKHGEGAAGVFTGGASDRTSALAHAVAGALGPFVTDHYR
ncbi:inosine/xanthosine triphosphatase [Salinirubellus salinus]|jgi:inosine/xanthosine triphosphatase|uniref:inosine/xanthosine triphosphatase n=1 Tax=Salinirubellus salinus TaxID=1364945 RepID=A0A9E7UBA6_9EURY|nr:inosine/xanthosine triphosphatase [Salinirubellus salinus]UWM54887.1 inosine/xanthosine triphosphatase [Salinirubellus salinus]